jgi:hypothetical protein
MQKWRKEYLKNVDEYVKETNQFMGLLPITLGLSCINKPSYLAWGALFFTVCFWHSRIQSGRHCLDALKEIKDEAVQPTRIIMRCWFALLGWTFLGVVALGLCNW